MPDSLKTPLKIILCAACVAAIFPICIPVTRVLPIESSGAESTMFLGMAYIVPMFLWSWLMLTVLFFAGYAMKGPFEKIDLNPVDYTRNAILLIDAFGLMCLLFEGVIGMLHQHEMQSRDISRSMLLLLLLSCCYPLLRFASTSKEAEIKATKDSRKPFSEYDILAPTVDDCVAIVNNLEKKILPIIFSKQNVYAAWCKETNSPLPHYLYCDEISDSLFQSVEAHAKDIENHTRSMRDILKATIDELKHIDSVVSSTPVDKRYTRHDFVTARKIADADNARAVEMSMPDDEDDESCPANPS